jgi:hypothetical protein
VQRITATVSELPFDRLYDNFGRPIAAGADAAVNASAERYCAWVRGDFDGLT